MVLKFSSTVFKSSSRVSKSSSTVFNKSSMVLNPVRAFSNPVRGFLNPVRRFSNRVRGFESSSTAGATDYRNSSTVLNFENHHFDKTRNIFYGKHDQKYPTNSPNLWENTKRIVFSKGNPRNRDAKIEKIGAAAPK